MEFMNNAFGGLNYWAYMSFFFLILSGFCSGKAVKASTTKIVEKGVNATLNGTDKQLTKAAKKITHPVQDLYAYLINSHRPISDNLIGKINMYLAIHKNLISTDNEKVQISGKELSLKSLLEASAKTSHEISDCNNEYINSLKTLDNLINQLSNVTIQQ